MLKVSKISRLDHYGEFFDSFIINFPSLHSVEFGDVLELAQGDHQAALARIQASLDLDSVEGNWPGEVEADFYENNKLSVKLSPYVGDRFITFDFQIEPFQIVSCVVDMQERPSLAVAESMLQSNGAESNVIEYKHVFDHSYREDREQYNLLLIARLRRAVRRGEMTADEAASCWYNRKKQGRSFLSDPLPDDIDCIKMAGCFPEVLFPDTAFWKKCRKEELNRKAAEKLKYDREKAALNELLGSLIGKRLKQETSVSRRENVWCLRKFQDQEAHDLGTSFEEAMAALPNMVEVLLGTGFLPMGICSIKDDGGNPAKS